ncbi:MAG: T9SS type A sorting domain-containing protein [Bacteroidales bacterium]|nr:T9SS type A sorting domain-containing protein [Bacteroidales bacterium]MBN2818500.1 T9SS type A sorting domain-containing protein [Bacteroidales bacterium]
MKPRNIIFSIGIIALLFFFNTSVLGQFDTLYYLYSDFETTDDQAQWASLPSDDPNIKWEFMEGSKDDYPPPLAASGNYNATFYYPDVVNVYSRRLESPQIDLSEAKKPQLAFRHAQYSSFDQDYLRLLLKAGSGAQWDTIESWENAIDNWELEVYSIDEIDKKYLCEGFQVAFLGYSLPEGNGVCVDSVIIEEKDTIPKYVSKLQYSAVDHEIITSKALQVPLIRVQVVVLGNDGPSNLENLAFTLDVGSSSYFKSNGFRLYHTLGNTFRNEAGGVSTQVGSAISMTGSSVSFTSLGHELKLGTNYLWVTADFAEDVEHNSEIEFSVEIESFKMNDTLLPATRIDGLFNDFIKEAVFYDNFETDLGWDFTTWGGDFERGIPLGKSSGSTRDPDYTYSGTNVLGTDLSANGLYLPNIPAGSSYHAQSPSFNLRYYDRAKVYMRTWNDFYFDDSTTISFSNDGGVTWEKVWYNVQDNPAFIPEWVELLFDNEADNFLSRQENVMVRFSIDKTFSNPRAGFNIDQFIISGNHLETDVGVTDILSPNDDCIGFGNDTVKIEVTNYAEGASPVKIPVFYALWGLDSIIVRDTINEAIPKDGSVIFTFSQLADFPRGDIYTDFTVGVELTGDEDSRNDQMVKILYIQDNHTPPEATDFEYKGGVWRASKEDSWACIISDGSIPVLTESPNSWILSPYGEYPNGDTAYVTSACYDLTNANRNIIQMKYWMQSEAGVDGMALEYTVNDGATWQLVDKTEFGPTWGWYDTDVSALGHIGWSGASGGWQSVRELLPEALSTEPKVKFRVVWMSDASTNARGAAFDDFAVYPAPADVGVSYIELPEDACQFVNSSTTTVYVKNYGFNTVEQNDTIIIGVDFESDASVIDTFLLNADLEPGDSLPFTLATNYNIDAAGTYNIMAYTLIEDDPYYYYEYNDTTTKQFNVWPNPGIILADTIGSRQPDTVVVKPGYPDWVPGYSYLWNDASTDSILDVEGEGYYKVTVTEPDHLCSASDSVLVLLLYFDAGCDSVLAPQSTCELKDPEDQFVTIQIKNTGTDSLLADDKIQAFFRVNGGTIYEDTITLTQSFYAGRTFPHTFSNDPFDFSAYGTYTIEAWAKYSGGDKSALNDSSESVVHAFGYTPLDLGADVVVAGIQYTLDAGSGFDTYLWSNGDTTQTTLIESSGDYSIFASDGNNCPAYDTINVWFKIRDVYPLSLISPVTSCERENTEEVSVSIYNNGSDTVLNSETITITYKLNGGELVSEIVNPAIDILPGTQYIHTFENKVDLSTYSEYSFELTSKASNELILDNDTLIASVATNANPVINFGADKIIGTTQYTLNASSGAGHSYLWHDNATDSVYIAWATGEYSCTVTNTNTGCWGADTVYLTFDYADYGIQGVTINSNPCQGQSQNNVEVEILYAQGSNARTGVVLPVAFQVDNEEPVVQNITINAVWLPLTSQRITLSNPITFNQSGNGRILRVFLDDFEDLNANNDSLIRNDVNVLPKPVVDFGGDTIGVCFPYVLDPGSNFTSYQWQDNSTNQTYTVSQDGMYSVVVTNAANCPAAQSVFVEENCISVDEHLWEYLDINIFPNPASSVLHIQIDIKKQEDWTVELMDITGRRVFSDIISDRSYYENKIEVGELQKGVYFISIRNSNLQYSGKVIVN